MAHEHQWQPGRGNVETCAVPGCSRFRGTGAPIVSVDREALTYQRPGWQTTEDGFDVEHYGKGEPYEVSHLHGAHTRYTGTEIRTATTAREAERIIAAWRVELLAADIADALSR